jgi:hypothetical protein
MLHVPVHYTLADLLIPIKFGERYIHIMKFIILLVPYSYVQTLYSLLFSNTPLPTTMLVASYMRPREPVVPCRAGIVNLGYVCPKWHPERFPRHAALTGVPNFFLLLLPDQLIYIVKNMCIYTHICDCVQTGFALTLLPNNTASGTFLHKSGTVRSVDWMFIIGAPAWRWLGEYVTMDKMFYYLLFKQEVVAAAVTSTFSSSTRFSRRPVLEI